MGADQGLLRIRADLCERIDSIADGLGRLRHAQLCGAVDALRHVAQDHGLTAVALLARAMESALAHGDRGATLLSHLELMREAVGCEQLSDAATEAFLAVAAVRLADPTLLRQR